MAVFWHCSIVFFFLFAFSLPSVLGIKPNFVIFFADDLGFGDLSCYGHPTSTTPNIDKLAKEGLRFTNFYSSAPVCSPSRAALMTGRYQTRSGIYPGVFEPDSIGGLPHNETTIAEYLKTAGYDTGMVGKWHLGVGEKNEYLPIYHGFDYYLGIPYSHDECPCNDIPCFYPNGPCAQHGATSMVHCPIFENSTIIQQPADLLTIHQTYVDAATMFIKKKAGNPFFLYVAFQHTHKPQFAGKEFTNSSSRGPFGDALNELDWNVGQIMTALQEAGVDKNTFIFFSSDNGPALVWGIDGGNPGTLKCGKGTTYEGGQRVPGIAWWPQMIKPGKTAEMASTLDLLPTILKIVDIQPKKDVTLDGYDMGPILFNNGSSQREVFYYYSNKPPMKDGVWALRYKQYKAHFFTQGSGLCNDQYPDMDCRPTHLKSYEDPPLLFDLFEDPSEVYALDSGYPDYESILKTVIQLKQAFDEKMVWGVSQIDRGTNKSLEPCAVPQCSPFPNCCRTTSFWQ